MKYIFFLSFLAIVSLASGQVRLDRSVIDESNNVEIITQVITIDSVWSGHPVGFCLLTHSNRQYISYYNANRNMVVGQRNLSEDKFQLHILPPTTRNECKGTSTLLGWDSHNYVTMGLDRDGYIHFSGNVHGHPLTYFRSAAPNDISTLEQIFEMTGNEEKRTTYPKFFKTREGELVYTYRDGGSGNGNQIYNIYDCATKTWNRLLDTPLTDGKGFMNAYISSPQLRKDNWYHTYWVWRDTPDCSTNHDLSYMKSPDLKNWVNAFGEPVELPATIEDSHVVVDPIPPKGGIINLAARFVLDEKNSPVFVYHKYDAEGNLQFYIARIQSNEWKYHQITDWDYRWEFSGNGSINSEVRLHAFHKRADGWYEVDFSHIKYGNGTLLLNENFENIGEVLKPASFNSNLDLEGAFPGLEIRTTNDIGTVTDEKTRYVLKWETLNRNRDKPRSKPWPEASQLYLFKLLTN